jgi:hypothetical protein
MSDAGQDDEVGLPKATVFKLIQGLSHISCLCWCTREIKLKA